MTLGNVPPAGVIESAFHSEKAWVSENHFPKSDLGSAQAVALGGNSMKRKTAVAGVEGDRSRLEPDEQEPVEYPASRPKAR